MAKKKEQIPIYQKRETWIGVIVALVILVTLFSMCSAPEQATAPEPEAQVAPEPEAQVEPEPEAVAVPEPEPEKIPNPEIEALMGRFDAVDNYQFILTEYMFLYGETRTDIKGTYDVNGDKVRIELAGTETMDGWSADYVYMDLAEESAKGYCVEFSCKTEELSDDVDYADYDFVRPEDWMDQVLFGDIKGTKTHNSRPVTIVWWESEEGTYFEALVDQYYGYPMRVIETSDEDRTAIISGFDYRDFSFNTATEEEVTPPY